MRDRRADARARFWLRSGHREPHPRPMPNVSLTVNGRVQAADVDHTTLLIDLLRGALGLTGTHAGCDTAQCGACTVLLDGRAVKSCTVLAVQASGREVTTVEGLAQDDRLHPLRSEEHTSELQSPLNLVCCLLL